MTARRLATAILGLSVVLLVAHAVSLASVHAASPGGTRWISIDEGRGAAVAWPEGRAPVPIVIVLHGTEGFYYDTVSHGLPFGPVTRADVLRRSGEFLRRHLES